MPQATPSAKSLVLDLLATLPPQYSVPVAALVRAAGCLGIAGNSVRVALARLRGRGLVVSDERGRYRLGAAAGAVSEQVRSWRSLEDGVGPWDKSWVAVEPARLERGDRCAARRRDQALRLLGMRPLTQRLYVRPDNLAGGVEAVRARLAALGVGPGTLVFRLSALDAVSDARARGLWDARALEAAYDATCARLAASAARLPDLTRSQAMAESFLLGGDAVRQIVLDPLLPAPIVSQKKRRALVAAMRRYDRLGRRCWKGWAGESVALEQSAGEVCGLGAAGDALAQARKA